MRTKKRSLAAKQREKLKKQRIDPDAPSANASDGSCYAPSECSMSDTETVDAYELQPQAGSQRAAAALMAVIEPESDECSESDGEIMLTLNDGIDENDWDPTCLPDLYPIFTQPVHSFLDAENALRATYTGESRSTAKRRQRRMRALKEAAKSCPDIGTFFKAEKPVKLSPCGNDREQNGMEGAPPAIDDERLQSDADDAGEAGDSGNASEADEAGGADEASDAETPALRPPMASAPTPQPNRNVAPALVPPTCTVAASIEGAVEQLNEKLTLEAAVHSPFESDEPQEYTEGGRGLENTEARMSQSNRQENVSVKTAAPYLGTKLWQRMHKLRGKLGYLRMKFEKEIRSGKKADPRDLSDVQTLLDYCTIAEQLCKDGSSNAEVTASLQIARTKVLRVCEDGDIITKGAWYARTLRSKAAHVRSCGELPTRKQGRGATHDSLLDRKEVIDAVKAFVGGVPVGKVTPLSLMKEVNTVILPGLALPKASITENTAKKWLLRLGYRRDSYWKGIYMDGHERADVVKYRKLFLDKLRTYEGQIQQFTDKECEPIPLNLPPGSQQIIPVFHDECCFHANDQSTHCWVGEGQTLLRQKVRGRLVHVSDFIIEQGACGRLKLTEEQIEQQKLLPEAERLERWDARKIIYPGKNQDPYWDMPQLINQVKLAIKIFEFQYPGAQMMFFFDQSLAHNAYAGNALNARKMNVSPGGKQPLMRYTFIREDNPNPFLQGKPQSMAFPPSHPKHPGEPKGMEEVLRERGLWDVLQEANNGKRPVGRCKICKATAVEREKMLAEAHAIIESNPDSFGSIDNVIEITQNESLEATEYTHQSNRFCCMENCLAHEADFVAEKPLLQLVIEEAGHLCILLPKFHCELNPIEMYWGYAKKKFRAHSNGSFPLAKKLVPESLDSCSVTTIRRFFQKTWRYMDVYRHGLTGMMAEHAVKKFTSHRKISGRIMMEVAMLIL